MRHSYTTQGTCCRKIDFDLEGDIVKNIVFTGGCPGNVKAVAILADGLTAEEIVRKLSGNLCMNRGTSCADQLARAVKAAYEEENGQR